MDRRERSVEIREFKEDGLDDTTLKFSSLEDERKKKRKNDTKRTRNKIKGI